MNMLKMLQNILLGVGQKIQQLKWVNDAMRITGIMYQTYGDPVVRFFTPPVRGIWNLYKRAFVKMSFVGGKISHQRAAFVAVPVLAASTWFVVAYGFQETYDFTVDGIGVLTERHEHVYLTGADPVPGDDTESIFRAKGCSRLPCTDDTATYYHIRPNSVKTLIYLVTKGTIYLPEQVEAAIPDQLSECDVTIQWFRWRAFKMYNTITEVSCQPVSQGK